MIRKLPPHIVHQIAAGEVVERPSSVLKELIENSLDAGATQIEVSFEDGGLKKLIVEDNGSGISKEDLPLAFEAHATSKMKELDDLESLSSLGFRGEAVGSIASVSEVEIWSCPKDASHGSRTKVSFGRSSELEPADKRLGTQVIVHELFSRHPARFKFMRTARSEALQLLKVWKKYCLCHPEVSWKFLDAKTGKVLQRPAESSFDRSLWFFHSSDGEQWTRVEEKILDWSIEIIFQKPRFVGRARSGVHLFLNRRPIKDNKLEFALKRAFEGYTEFPRNISAAVYLEGPPNEFDVNVHPMKTEIRFLEADRLFSYIVKTVRPALESGHKEELSVKDFMQPLPESTYENPRRQSLEFGKHPKIDEPKMAEPAGEEFAQEIEVKEQAPLFNIERKQYEYLGSIDHTYLIVKKNEELLLFDQHALHERILYEGLLKQFRDGTKIHSQRLLFPVPVVFVGAEELSEKEELLGRLGFELRVWNDGKVQVLAAPALLKRGYEEVLEKLAHCSELPIDTLSREVLSTVACHSAVRAHDKLDPKEIDQLLADFETKDALGHCPHGRPTYVKFDTHHLEKLFHRVI